MVHDAFMSVSIKAQGSLLTADGAGGGGGDGVVYLPFGCEYSIMLKNMHSLKAQTQIWVNKVSATDGAALIVHPNTNICIERFFKPGQWQRGNKFKFIEKTEAISSFRGDKIDDGLIRIQFEFEKPKPVRVLAPSPRPCPSPYYRPTLMRPMGASPPAMAAQSNSALFGSAPAPSGCSFGYLDAAPAVAAPSAVALAAAAPAPVSKSGITVAGGISDQRFEEESWFETDGVKHVIVLQLKGGKQPAAAEKLVASRAIVTCTTCAESVAAKKISTCTSCAGRVRTIAACTSCGEQNVDNSKFCRECGTGLQVVV